VVASVQRDEELAAICVGGVGIRAGHQAPAATQDPIDKTLHGCAAKSGNRLATVTFAAAAVGALAFAQATGAPAETQDPTNKTLHGCAAKSGNRLAPGDVCCRCCGGIGVCTGPAWNAAKSGILIAAGDRCIRRARHISSDK
jgi:hypothetical protein